MTLYAELHAHSNFSFLEGASHIEELALAGFTAGQVESLRRAMSRKRSREAIARLKQQFIEGCLQNGASPETAEAVFAKIAGFAESGFPKAHAAAFGLLAYQTAWRWMCCPPISTAAGLTAPWRRAVRRLAGYERMM